MKLLTALFLLALGTTVHAYEPIELEYEVIYFGAINQTFNDRIIEGVEFRRTPTTPKEVLLKYEIKEERKECLEFENRRVWVPAQSTVTCSTNIFGRTTCRDSWVQAHFRTERHCVDERTFYVSTQKEIIFDFARADRLRGNEEEIFHVDFIQHPENASRIDLRGRVVSAAVDYEIYVSLFGSHLKFVAR